MPTDHNIRQLIINKMTDAQYEQAVKSADELYLTPDSGSGGGTDLPDQTGQSGKFLTTNGSTLSWGSVPAGTVTSVRVQATSPVVSSVNTAQTASLNTTISLADGYGDTKNPYASKTANTVLAAPNGSNGAPSFRALVKADIPLASETAASGGTTTSLVTTGEKYTWNNKQDALSAQTAYTSKGTSSKVPQITTNTLGQVTGITEVDITHQSIKTLKTDNTTAQSTSSSEAVAGSGTINLHKVSKTGSYNDLLNKPTIPQGTVTSVQVQAGTGLSSSTSTAQNTTLSTTISVASGYKLPTTTEWSGKQDALPTQSGNSGKFLTTNGSTLSWGTVDALPDQTGNSGKFLTTNGSTMSWVEIQGGSDIDNSTITKNTDDELQTVGVKDVRTDNTIKIWTGTKAQYDNLISNDWSIATYSILIEYDNWMHALAYGNGKFVAISETGYGSTSTDGITWSTPVQSIESYLSRWGFLAYGNGKFVAMDTYGNTSVSTDGINWTPITNNSELGYFDWVSLTYGNGKFVAIASNGGVTISTDGITWSVPIAQTIETTYNDWCNLAYGNGKFVVIDSDSYISTSEDGITWATPTQNSNLNSLGPGIWSGALTYGNSKFMLVSIGGDVSTSTDGVTWSIPVNDSNLDINFWCALTYGNSKFVAMGERGAYFSTKNDGINSYTLYNIINDGLYLGTIPIADIGEDPLPSQSGQSGKFLTTNGSTMSWGSLTANNVTVALGYTPYNSTNPNGYTSNTGTVKSVQVQAGTGLASSTSTAQNTTLSTTISIASGYKLPTTTEWGNKQDVLPTQSGNDGKFLTTDGTTMSWGEVSSIWTYDSTNKLLEIS